MADHTGSMAQKARRARSITTTATVATVVLLVLEPFVLSRLGNSSTPAILVGILVLLALAPVMLIAGMVYLRFFQRQTFGEAVVGIAPPPREASPDEQPSGAERRVVAAQPQRPEPGGQPARSLTKERQQPAQSHHQAAARQVPAAPPVTPPAAQPVQQPPVPATPAPAPTARPDVLSAPAPAAPAAPRPTAPQPAPTMAAATVSPAPRPTHFKLVLDDGVTLDIAQPTVIGRQPSSGTDVGEVAIPVDDNTRSISKVHARLTPRADGLVVEDLGSTNGTLITVANGQHRRLTIGTPMMVPLGGTVQFGQRTARVTQ